MSRLRRWQALSAAACCLMFLPGTEPASAGETVLVESIAEEAAAPAAPAAPAATTPAARRSWGPEQATGEPDTPEAGDQVTAWASLSPDGSEEWLVCEYPQAAMLAFVRVHETYNPGALVKVTVFNAKDEEVVAWEGDDPTPRDQPKGISVIPVKLDFPVQRVKLYLDSAAVPGWNEIDAIGIEDTGKQVQWATKVLASTTYAEPNPAPEPVPAPPVPPVVAVPADQLLKLQQEIDALQEQVEKLNQLRDDIQELKTLLKQQAEKK